MKRSPSPANSRGPAPGREDCLIPDAVIQEVRERVDIVAVIGRHLELKKSGRTFKGNCVFHGEKTPSFHVYPEDKHFKCYGCGAYGDVFAFLQKLEGKEFPEVVKELAQEMGIEIPEASEEDSEEAKARRKERGEITLACEECKHRNYQTNKSKRNNPDRVTLRKYCRWCRKHTSHRETR